MDRQELELALRELIADIQHNGALCRQMGDRSSLPASKMEGRTEHSYTHSEQATLLQWQSALGTGS
jgi:hypothetical protein